MIQLQDQIPFLMIVRLWLCKCNTMLMHETKTRMQQELELRISNELRNKCMTIKAILPNKVLQGRWTMEIIFITDFILTLIQF